MSESRSNLSIQLIPFPETSILDMHRTLLADRVRTSAFERSLVATVRPNDIVGDLGAGSGILAMTAASLGAGRVFAIEQNPVAAAFAERAVARNGFADSVTVVRNHSMRVSLPTKIDVLVSECIGWAMYGGDMFASVVDARDRWLKSDGIVIPREVSLFAAPVEASRESAHANFFESGNICGFDFSGCSSEDHVFLTDVPESALVADPQPLARADVTTGYPNEMVDAEVDFRIDRPCRMHGFALWFDADLCDGVRLSTAPGMPSTVWRQTFIGCGPELELKKGAVVSFRFELARSLSTLRQRATWGLSVNDGSVSIERKFSTMGTAGRADSSFTATLDGKEWLSVVRSRVRAERQRSAGYWQRVRRRLRRVVAWS